VTLRSALVCAVLVLAPLAMAGCSSQPQGTDTDPSQVDATTPPPNGACRVLTPADVKQEVNATRTVPCSSRHTAQTYAVGELPSTFDHADYESRALFHWAYQTCSSKFERFVGADDSLVLRTVISWVWFRPSRKAWSEGARWYRCDVYGGNSTSTTYQPLPQTAKGMLAGRPDDRWLVCAVGPSFPQATKVPCSEKHTWRAVTTIKLGEPNDSYPGDRVAESRSDAFCGTSVKAWLNYPPTFQYAYTFFHKAEWDLGNRRSVCWAQTDE
jgi:hypothetical protein